MLDLRLSRATRGIIIEMPLGLYISVPFCRTKCSYCNFASDVFSRSVFQRYVDRVCADMKRDNPTLAQIDGHTDRIVDSIYLGGGTPTVLDPAQLQRLFVSISENFEVQAGAEITVECAPGTLTPGCNRSSEALRREPCEPGRAVVR
jgi:oxygen-independent coproporphyrinogen III oxidase